MIWETVFRSGKRCQMWSLVCSIMKWWRIGEKCLIIHFPYVCMCACAYMHVCICRCWREPANKCICMCRICIFVSEVTYYLLVNFREVVLSFFMYFYWQEPKLVPGKLAVCHFCGYTSLDFFRCQRCKRKLPENCKSIPVPDGLTKKCAKEGSVSEVQLICSLMTINLI